MSDTKEQDAVDPRDAEIERLRAENARLESDLRHMAEDAGNESCAAYAVRSAELERLCAEAADALAETVPEMDDPAEFVPAIKLIERLRAAKGEQK